MDREEIEELLAAQPVGTFLVMPPAWGNDKLYRKLSNGRWGHAHTNQFSGDDCVHQADEVSEWLNDDLSEMWSLS